MKSDLDRPLAATALIGDVDADPAAIKFLLVHTNNGIIGFRRIAKSYKSKSTRAAGLAITHHNRLVMKMLRAGRAKYPCGVLVISFRVHRKETDVHQ